MTELWRLSAVDTVALLRKGEVSPQELIDVAAARIEAVDGIVNALPTRCYERARERAEAARGTAPLYGLPVAIKDSMDVAGVRSTQGSPIFADTVPARSDIQVERLEANGALVLARSNAPEFAAGANTFNEVFGATRNPFDTRMTCGGSSGGSAVALATGMVWLANGSDLGGSLRIPASFCSVVGFRPSPGVLAHGAGVGSFDDMPVSGPMARNMADLELMLGAMTGYDVRDPLSLPFPRVSAKRKLRAAFSADLGFLPVDPEVRAICAAAARRLTEAEVAVDEGGPDFSGASEIFGVLRAFRFATAKKDLLAQHRDRMKPEVIWNIERGLKLSADDVGRAMQARVALYQRVAAFFQDHDLLLAPVVMVPPFPVETRWLEQCEGVRFDNYVEWLGHTFAVTLTRCPALSLPCGFTRSGLPVGLQVVAPPMHDSALIDAAKRFEAVFGLAGKVPVTPASQ